MEKITPISLIEFPRALTGFSNQKGGGVIGSSKFHSRRIIIENGFALRLPEHRQWLTKLADGLSNREVTGRAEKELGVQRRTAAALARIYGVRNTPEFKECLSVFPYSNLSSRLNAN